MSIASRESQSREDVRAKKAAAQKAAMTAPGMYEKLSAAQAEINSDPEFRKRRSEAKKEPCTVDGITIFESRTDLIRTLGKGKNGLRYFFFTKSQRFSIWKMLKNLALVLFLAIFLD